MNECLKMDFLNDIKRYYKFIVYFFFTFYVPIPRSESSSVLIKLSRISAMIFVKQKNESASAFSMKKNQTLNYKKTILSLFTLI